MDMENTDSFNDKELEDFWTKPNAWLEVIKIVNDNKEQLRLMELSRNRCDDL